MPSLPIPDSVMLHVPCILTLIKPCGNVNLTKDGVDLVTPLQTLHVPGPKTLKEQVRPYKAAFSDYTKYFVAAAFAVWGTMTVCIPSKRNKCIQSVKDTMSGNVEDRDDEDPDKPTPEEEEAEKKERMDPKSPDFICPGNIYRLLAVLHPGKIGYMRWGKFAVKAGICAYMQLYIPFKIAKGTFVEWEFHYIKSPLWFAEHAVVFATMFAALASLCNMFQGKCEKSIRNGAEANQYLMMRESPPKAAADPQPSDASQEDAGLLAAAPIELPKLSPGMIAFNEMFWCYLSMFNNVSMSLMLEFIMFLKVSTFTGAIDHVAVVAVSLYFIFDLDDKIMDSDPKLRPKYRKAVLNQTVLRSEDSNPIVMMRLAGMSVALTRFLVPFGLLMIILLSWRNTKTGYVIGGDGF